MVIRVRSDRIGAGGRADEAFLGLCGYVAARVVRRAEVRIVVFGREYGSDCDQVISVICFGDEITFVVDFHAGGFVVDDSGLKCPVTVIGIEWALRSERL